MPHVTTPAVPLPCRQIVCCNAVPHRNTHYINASMIGPNIEQRLHRFSPYSRWAIYSMQYGRGHDIILSYRPTLFKVTGNTYWPFMPICADARFFAPPRRRCDMHARQFHAHTFTIYFSQRSRLGRGYSYSYAGPLSRTYAGWPPGHHASLTQPLEAVFIQHFPL